MSEITKLRLFTIFITVIMLSCFLFLHKNKSDNQDYGITNYRYYRYYRY